MHKSSWDELIWAIKLMISSTIDSPEFVRLILDGQNKLILSWTFDPTVEFYLD